MIKLTRLNRESFYLNALMIERIESTPDTVVTLTSGRKMVVLESAEEVRRRVMEVYRQIGLVGGANSTNQGDPEQLRD